jgi:hypothetical protein
MIEDFKPYIDPTGMVSGRPNPDGPEGNAILRVAEALVCWQRGEPYTMTMAYVAANGVRSCQSDPGLFHRTPKNCAYHYDQEGVDDYIGLGVVAALMDRVIAQRILKYGRENKFHWKFLRLRYYYRTDGAKYVEDDLGHAVLVNWKGEPAPGDLDTYAPAWLGRHLSLITHLEWAAGEKPNWFRRLCWFYSVALEPKKGDQDSWILTWLMVVVAGNKGWPEKLATAIRAWRLKRLHPEGLRGILTAYYAHEHAIARYCEDERKA